MALYSYGPIYLWPIYLWPDIVLALYSYGLHSYGPNGLYSYHDTTASSKQPAPSKLCVWASHQHMAELFTTSASHRAPAKSTLPSPSAVAAVARRHPKKIACSSVQAICSPRHFASQDNTNSVPTLPRCQPLPGCQHYLGANTT